MEVQSSSLCSGCLSVERRMLHIRNSQKEQCFWQIIKELRITIPNSLALWLCYECEANITRFTKFKLQVQHSYQILHNLTLQNAIPYKQRLSIQKQANITLTPNTDDTSTIVKTEVIPLIKYETDLSDDDDKLMLSNIENEPKESDKTTENQENHAQVNKNDKIKKVKKIKSKIKIKIVDKVKKKGLYKEVVLTEEEIVKERNELALRDDYVNAMFRCDRCLVTFPNVDDMKDHAYKKHELHSSKHKCSICECAFNTEVAYNYHRRRHYRRYECLVCKFTCAGELTAANHCKAHYQSASYDLEPKIYANGKLALEENGLNGTKSEQKYPCLYCPKVFIWKTSLRKHSETHKIEAGQKRKPYCEPCRLSFTTTANLQKHVKTSSKHQIQLKLRKLKETQPEDSSDKQIADIKSSVNSKREVFSCAQCDKKFQWRGNLMRHLDSHAARAKGELVCEPCQRSFSSIATYKQHMKISKKHASENDYKYMCSDCGKKFASKTKLKDHVDWEHLKNYVHTCTHCQKIFKTHTSLYLHRQVVHRQASSQHLCENCGKSFANQTKLRSHIIALHTNESPYKCGVCGARFSWHSCLSRHLRRVHRTTK